MVVSRRTIVSGCLLGLLVLTVAMSGCGGGGSSLPAQALQNAVQTRVAESTQVPGAVLAVSRGNVTWIGAAGKADSAAGTPMRANMRFRVGSLTKQFTAALILQLAEEGKLSLDDTLRQWLPQFQLPYDDQITIRMLLNHTSGVPEFTTNTFWTGEVFPNPTRAWTPSELVALAKQGTSVAPGTVFSYCNTGYVLAGLIAEAASGQPLATAMANRFFTPLGMNDTELAADGNLSGSFAHGYLLLPGGQTPGDVSNWNPSLGWAAGAIVTTGQDMLVWASALFGGRVLSANSLHLMITPEAPSTNYGFGLGLQPAADGRTFIYHGGEIPGYSAVIARYNPSDLTIVVLTNREDIYQEVNDVASPLVSDAAALLP